MDKDDGSDMGDRGKLTQRQAAVDAGIMIVLAPIADVALGDIEEVRSHLERAPRRDERCV